MRDLVLALFVIGFLMVGFRRPFIFVLAYAYIDILAPQRITYFLLNSVPISLISFLLAVLTWLVFDNKQGSRFSFRQFLILALLLYCGVTTMSADFAKEALFKWDWVWKALVFAIFLPLTLRTRLRIEAMVLIMTLSAGAIIINGGIKTVLSGGGYGVLKLYVDNNTGLYEGSIISCVAISLIPLVVWLSKYGTIFPKDRFVQLFAVGLIFACCLMPVGTQARTGLVCLAVLIVLSLRTVKNRFMYIAAMGLLAAAAVPFLPSSFTERMDTIKDHSGDQSANTRIAVWNWTLDYVKDHPWGGGFESYLQNSVTSSAAAEKSVGGRLQKQAVVVTENGRAFHSSYFEMLGEQGYFGLGLWLFLQIMGIFQMEMVWRKFRNRKGINERWVAPLAAALQQGQIVYLVGSTFVGIAFQPFIYMLVALQCALAAYAKRLDRGEISRQDEQGFVPRGHGYRPASAGGAPQPAGQQAGPAPAGAMAQAAAPQTAAGSMHRGTRPHGTMHTGTMQPGMPRRPLQPSPHRPMPTRPQSR